MDRLLKELKIFYKKHRRDLPWRHTSNPYKILVSEVMLQQTQVERVVPYYRRFIKQFPTARALARAPFPKVLRAWSGLGYNRRAKYLHTAAKMLSEAGLPRTGVGHLPGVGPYTAAAVAAFAYNQPAVFVETNIRTVFIHRFFPRKKRVADKDILPLVEKALKQSGMQPREFYGALMDYGAHLKRSGVRLNIKSAHYAKQQKFAGSSRQLRGVILRALLKRSRTAAELAGALSHDKKLVERELARLCKEALVVRKGRTFSVAG